MFYPKGGRSGLMVFTLDWHPGGRGLTFAGSAIFLKNQEWNGMMDSFDGVHFNLPLGRWIEEDEKCLQWFV